MKCPSCGFNSFEGLPACKKCGAELGELRHRSPQAGAARRSRGSRPAPSDEPHDLDLPFEVEQGVRRGEKDPAAGTQGELFAADRPEAAQAETSAMEIGEEFSGGPTLLADLPQEADDGEEATSREDDAGDGTAGAQPPSWRPRLLASGFDLLVVASSIGLFVLCGNMVLAGGAGALPDALLLSAYLPVGAAVCFAYFTFFHYLTGQTPGKMLFGLLVECREGGALCFSRAFLRSFGGGLSLLALGCGFAPILWRADGRGWSDRLAGSRVVSLSDEGDE